MKITKFQDSERNLSLSRRGAGRRADHRITKHKAATCTESGGARYARREQAQDVVKGLRWREARRLRAAQAQGPERAQVAHGGGEVQTGFECSHVDWYSHPCEFCKGWHIVRLGTSTPGAEQTRMSERFHHGATARECAIHGLDIENLLGGGGVSREDATALLEIYRRQGPGVASSDLVIVAASLHVAEKFADVVATVFAGTTVRWAVGSTGPDGADHALLRTINVRRHAKRFDVLYVASGDHIFTPLVREARLFGMKVRIVTAENADGKSSLARELKATAVPRIFIRARSRELERKNREAIELVASRSHRRVHFETVAA